MAKDFFTVKFSTLNDKRKAKDKVILELSMGQVRLREWSRYFNPYKEASSLAEIWLRIYYLPVEMWTQEIIAGIGYALGHPLRIDHAAHGQAGHFARVQVKVDMAKPLLEYMDDENKASLAAAPKSKEHPKARGTNPSWQPRGQDNITKDQGDIVKDHMSGPDLAAILVPIKENELPPVGVSNWFDVLDDEDVEGDKIVKGVAGSGIEGKQIEDGMTQVALLGTAKETVANERGLSRMPRVRRSV
ncbi:uncharacterized protein LOC130990687 [Salvia miltiorrhiza]|uniref:uncharacterized protein LOC130990687 n=1 Tax=Salvia miltiorrhiza TaxID=226208 RepID=UPI0025AC0538|nr:uncharacterized protein LOC130990687 [Salvia miltiorrhiza]